MSLSLCLNPITPFPKTHLNRPLPIFIPSKKAAIFTPPYLTTPKKPTSIKSAQENSEPNLVTQANPKWEKMLSTAASLYPLYVTAGGVVACLRPTTFSWFVRRSPNSYSLALGFIMLAMGITLEVKDLVNLFMQRPLSILFGCVAQYTIMPALGMVISKSLGLSPSLSVGLILLACCPGGTASNVVTLIAQGDVPLSIVMTVCTTLGAVLLTPLLTKILVGTYVPVNAVKLSVSTLQLVVAPILLGSYIQSTFPEAVKIAMPFAPLLTVLAASLLASSTLTIERVYSLSGKLLSFSFLGMYRFSRPWTRRYMSAAFAGFREPQRRAVAIEVGMQNSSLGVVLATSHFTSPMVALPAAMSAVVMNIMGSSLGVFWRYIHPADSESHPKGDV
ncbi:hypothetical protein RJ639_037600 [Escallonia herrerae]|uniref:Uncharacterized protein n=1 Tax=Escallonia herrerae TaxID=1293975 RepID=A0AA88WI17_9ASTE|nr:hypothetical protein RJ639_037600 [Escallonia herrerae]